MKLEELKNYMRVLDLEMGKKGIIPTSTYFLCPCRYQKYYCDCSRSKLRGFYLMVAAQMEYMEVNEKEEGERSGSG